MKVCCCCGDNLDPDVDDGRDCESCGKYVCSECDVPEVPCICVECDDGGTPFDGDMEDDYDDIDELADEAFDEIEGEE